MCVCIGAIQLLHNTNTSTVEPRYKEVRYNKILLQQGNFAGPNSLYFFVSLP